jgi:predicted SAM-dependent methyltransferase
MLSKPEYGYIRESYFRCCRQLDKIEFPEQKVQFIFANFAFENLRDDQLEPTMKKCIDNLVYGGIMFIKEPHPLKSKTVAEFIPE